MPPMFRSNHARAFVAIAAAAFSTTGSQAQNAAIQSPGPAPAQLASPIATPAATPLAAPPAADSTLQSLRARQIELHYRVAGSAPDSIVELWYTRDRGASWQAYGKDDDRTSPMLFDAPSEGLYGFMLVPHLGGQPVRPLPTAYEAPQRWVFIDATPPLAQWHGVEPAENFATSRVLQLRWTAHDDNLAPRPVSLSYQSSADQNWNEIDNAVANTGLYDWRVPETVAGAVSFKLIIRDQGGHAVERTFGPIALDKLARLTVTTATTDRPTAPAASPTPATRPDLLSMLDSPAAPASQPATPHVDLLKQRMAADLYRQGSWYLVHGQYALAAERMREAIENDPDLLEARHDLAGIFYRQQDYDRAIAEYQSVLSRNANYESALYGAALAYVAKRDYHQSREMLTRLLKINDRNAEAWLDLGDVTFMMGDVINARANWRRVQKLDSATTDVVSKAQRRLELYGPTDELSSAKKENSPQ